MVRCLSWTRECLECRAGGDRHFPSEPRKGPLWNGREYRRPTQRRVCSGRRELLFPGSVQRNTRIPISAGSLRDRRGGPGSTSTSRATRCPVTCIWNLHLASRQEPPTRRDHSAAGWLRRSRPKTPVIWPSRRTGFGKHSGDRAVAFSTCDILVRHACVDCLFCQEERACGDVVQGAAKQLFPMPRIPADNRRAVDSHKLQGDPTNEQNHPQFDCLAAGSSGPTLTDPISTA